MKEKSPAPKAFKELVLIPAGFLWYGIPLPEHLEADDGPYREPKPGEKYDPDDMSTCGLIPIAKYGE